MRNSEESKQKTSDMEKTMNKYILGKPVTFKCNLVRALLLISNDIIRYLDNAAIMFDFNSNYWWYLELS
jgi:hypothetical protein